MPVVFAHRGLFSPLVGIQLSGWHPEELTIYTVMWDLEGEAA